MNFRLVLLFILYPVMLLAQQKAIPAKVISKVAIGTERYIGTDAFGWKYTIKNNVFIKQKDGKNLKYNSVSLGDIYRADLQSPLQIVLFYKNFNTAVLLDNQLNETTRINFSQLQQPLLAEAVGLASQNRLWVYDTNTQQVGLYDINKESFKTLTPPFNKTLQYYQSGYNYFYWVDDSNNLYAVNVFGKVNSLGQLPSFKKVKFINDKQILLEKDDVLYLYSPQKNSLQKIEIIEKSFDNFYYSDQILSIFTNNEIIQYNVTLPE
ncbi:hypothetical protein DVK85_03345 [Flavobacterium arcticum]|uniref:Uncharacterized protein n=1 Tax=Flavobacterium arcticum TaxID=1784713 RepID=A0A345H9Q4_9FLAO|nr:hypothetical protein [Flavobacterium arcticum]AXG73314.1 hypothetical protein DVK85_03345 [Flavobacterium arcticum]KAF2513109.1 hypothetical protein E0W72_01410 [Flavobacterium arcticum]